MTRCPRYVAVLLIALCACDSRGFVVGSPAPPVVLVAPPAGFAAVRPPGERAVILATSITPITSLSAASSGMAYSGESYDVACTVAGGAVTLYPAVHNGTTWEVYQGFPCTLNSALATQGTCTFPARTGSGLTWNAFRSGAGSVSGCTASGRAGNVPAPPISPAGGDGTVTSVGLSLPSIFTVTGSPVTTSGTLTAALASQAANLVLSGPSSGAAAAPTFRALVADDIPSLAASKITSGTLDIARIPTGTTSTTVPTGGVVSGAACAYPTTFTFNNAGQVTACTAGSAPTGGTVTSVGLSMPSIFTVTGSPVTTSGTLTAALASQAANLVLSGPSSGAAAAPTFRALVADDIPSLAASKITSGTLDIARIPTGTTSTTVPTGGVVSGAACAYPTTFTFNNAGQVTACTAGSAPTGGTVTSISQGTGMSFSANPITTTGTVNLADTAVTPGSYTLASITVDQQGRITAASSGSAAGPQNMQTQMSWQLGGAIDDFLIAPGTSSAANYSSYTGGTTGLGAPDFPLLTVNTARTVYWVMELGSVDVAGLLTLRKRTATLPGTWSTAATQATAAGAGAQRWSGSVSLAAGEAFGAHMDLAGIATVGYFFFGAGS